MLHSPRLRKSRPSQSLWRSKPATTSSTCSKFGSRPLKCEDGPKRLSSISQRSLTLTLRRNCAKRSLRLIHLKRPSLILSMTSRRRLFKVALMSSLKNNCLSDTKRSTKRQSSWASLPSLKSSKRPRNRRSWKRCELVSSKSSAKVSDFSRQGQLSMTHHQCVWWLTHQASASVMQGRITLDQGEDRFTQVMAKGWRRLEPKIDVKLSCSKNHLFLKKTL